MARVDQLLDLKAEVTCLICSSFFKEPVITECGHNFCRSCIGQLWAQPDARCPWCQFIPQRRTLQTNRQLVNLLCTVEEMVLTRARKVEKHLCDFHDEELCMFCRDDQQAVCSACIQSGSHMHHTLVQIEEAAQEYKEALQSKLELLKQKLNDENNFPAREQQYIRELEVKFKNQKDTLMSEFDTVEEALEQEKSHLIGSLERQHNNILKRIYKELRLQPRRKRALANVITEIVRKRHDSDLEFLKDVKDTLTRCDNLKAAAKNDQAQLQIDLERFKEQYMAAKHKFKKLKGRLSKQLVWTPVKINVDTLRENLKWTEVRKYPCKVTLDPNTGYYFLSVSNHGRRVIRLERPAVPDSIERFNLWPCILGLEKFTSGKHYWEIDVGYGDFWRVGVCDESANRRGRIVVAPYRGFWAIGLWRGISYCAYTSMRLIYLDIKHYRLRVVAVYLDYEAGIVAFYDAERKSYLFSFPPCPMPAILRPFFYTWSVSSPMRILPMNVH